MYTYDNVLTDIIMFQVSWIALASSLHTRSSLRSNVLEFFHQETEYTVA